MQGCPPQSSVRQPEEERKYEAVRRVIQRAGGGSRTRRCNCNYIYNVL